MKNSQIFKLKSFPELGKYRGRPCDIIAYQNFVEKLVECYDCNGVDDMSEILYP